MKFFLAIASLTGVSAILSRSGVNTRGKAASTATAEMKARAHARYMDSVRAEVSKMAAAAGKSYAEYTPDDDMVYGENGEEHELIDENPRIGVHQFLEAEDDAPEPEAYEGEDTAQIDADDEETNFGRDAPEGAAENADN